MRNSCVGSVRRITSMRPTGDIIAPPIPCSTRAAVNWVRSCAMPQSTEAMVKRAIAQANTVREPKRSDSQALAGMKIATVIR